MRPIAFFGQLSFVFVFIFKSSLKLQSLKRFHAPGLKWMHKLNLAKRFMSFKIIVSFRDLDYA